MDNALDIKQIILFASLGLIAGALVGFYFYRAYRILVRKTAEIEGQEIVDEAKSALELQLIEQKEITQEIEMEAWAKEETFLLKTEEKIEELEELYTERKKRADDRYSQARQRALQEEERVKGLESRLQSVEQKFNNKRAEVKKLHEDFTDKLLQKSGTSKDEVKQEIQSELLKDTQNRALTKATEKEANAKEHSEFIAKEILDRVFCRFQRPAPTERGIAPVYYADENAKKNFLALSPDIYKAVTEHCGCDIVVDQNLDMVGVAGYDPVRREHTRRLLERILKENKPGPKNPITLEWVKKVATNIKTEILRMTKHDGDQIAKELRLDNLHPEIRQVMGALKYRYSFTQNQYYHCGEVGWLCGLLSAELRTEDSKRARRAGLLHDLGKAMDHEMDGGHAVIGADFIAARGEKPDVVHAVRAHHYDEDPTSDMAYLVIAADAISGARPGARRSTVEAYTQKINDLQEIARSFDGVTDCFVLSGGRECRVLVNAKKIDDMRALKISQEMAKRIEEECNYPGQIKVVVVRETIAIEQTTKAHA